MMGFAQDEMVELDESWFASPAGIHGLGHASRAMVHAIEMAQEMGLSPWMVEAVTLGAAWHDIGRINDGSDWHHGVRSHGKVLGLGLADGIDPVVAESALFAVEYHVEPREHALNAAQWQADPEAALTVLSVVCDADALDRVRLGGLFCVDVSFLNNAVALGRLDRAMDLLGEIP